MANSDNPTQEIITILERHDVPLRIHPEEYKELLIDLAQWIVRRDHLVHDAGIEVGRKPINKDVFIANCAGFLEDHFPKGKTDMRGEAMVLVADITRLLMAQKVIKEES